MDGVFPFGFPFPTGFYLVLYVATFVMHVTFMHYVLAGALYVSWAGWRPGDGETPRIDQPLAAVLRDWLPFVLSAAITIGVAPLLFVQILYPKHFYTANTLLAWRWMVLIPALIAGFYLLYLMKSRAVAGWSFAARNAVSSVAAACFVFTAFCWTANHLLSIDPEQWPEVYATESVGHLALTIVPRLLLTIGASFATLAAIAGWQLFYQRRTGLDEAAFAVESRRLAWMSIGGLATAMVFGVVFLAVCQPAARSGLLSIASIPYLVLALLGTAGQIAAWVAVLRGREFEPKLHAGTSAAALAALLGIAVVRESARLSSLDVAALYEHHAAAREIGGFWLFLFTAVVNVGLIVFCIRLVRRSLTSPDPDADPPTDPPKTA